MMEKREKVIRELETIVDKMECEVAELVNYSDSELNDGLTVDCDWWSGTLGKLKDALEMLKAQEPIKPVFERQFMSNIELYDCGKCGTSLGAKGIAKYCSDCGQEVKWE